ncbi:non-homologous end-joining DNA ligase [Streptomyces zagrosensis]|uniref:DNA ligase (ATP) n=1 Tax=Streptomyces zagrosensis TaxID=1042984 RepID=A0A7W9QCH5_9ACTN|nr:non-homologous end-joining DNA ligase [Streptomyces zagrosensis]MBB5937735.1 bifunctional non-homologous end joining protein LigD [Streptomyces zagrosensis]
MSSLLDGLSAEQRRLLSDAPPGAELAAAPMLAQLSDRREFGTDWIFERKLDGVRALAVRQPGAEPVRLFSRSGQNINSTYPELVDVLGAQSCADFTVDGEIVAFSHGRTDFSRLQRRMGLTDPRRALATGVAVTYCLFDLLALDGYQTTKLPLRVRKSLLLRALDFREPLRLTTHRNQGGQDLLDQACSRGWEGLIAKRAQGRYRPRRSPDWLKLKCARGQEFVIGGFTEPSGSRTGFGALLLGYYEHDQLRYAGKVGTGYTEAMLRTVRARLDDLATTAAPFADPVRERHAHWARPELVAQLAFTEWTRDGMLRHPRFLGLREDKDPREVVREEPAKEQRISR